MGKSQRDERDYSIWLPIAVASLVSVAASGGIVWLALGSVKIGDIEKARWDHFLDLPPNAIGDTLAGIFGSLTLIWIVASVFQQSLELRAQRLEFKKMVEAQDAQVKALEAQSDIFKDERKRNNEKLANGALNNEIRLLIEDFLTASDDFVKITAAKDGQIEEKIFDFKISVNYTSDGYRENYRSLRMLLKSIRDLYSNISTPDSEFILKKSQAAVESLGGLRESLTSIYMFREKVSFVTIETLNTLNIPDAINKIENLEEIYRSVLNEDRAP